MSRARSTAASDVSNTDADTPNVTDHEIAAWVVQTCRMFGVSAANSYMVAAKFMEALEAEPK